MDFVVEKNACSMYTCDVIYGNQGNNITVFTGSIIPKATVLACP